MCSVIRDHVREKLLRALDKLRPEIGWDWPDWLQALLKELGYRCKGCGGVIEVDRKDASRFPLAAPVADDDQFPDKTPDTIPSVGAPRRWHKKDDSED